MSSKLKEIEEVLGRELPAGEYDLVDIREEWNAFFENPSKYAGTVVVAMVNQFIDEMYPNRGEFVDAEYLYGPSK